VVLEADTFASILRMGLLTANGMPQFDELSDSDIAALRQYIFSAAKEAKNAP